MQLGRGLSEALQGGRHFLALIQGAQEVPDFIDLLGGGLRHHLGDDLGADVLRLDVADVPDAPAVESDFGRVVRHESRKEAVEGPQGQALHGQQGLAQELPEERGVTGLRQVEAILSPQLGGRGLAGSGLGEFLQGPGHELRRGRPGEGQGDDLLGSDFSLAEFLAGEELHDAVRQGEGLAGAGGGQDDLVVDGEGAHGRTPPSWSVLRYSFMRRPFRAARMG